MEWVAGLDLLQLLQTDDPATTRVVADAGSGSGRQVVGSCPNRRASRF
ncbi:MAG: hypothetical protein ACJ764_00355 [Solirubrobacteraceae bacterium]